MTNIERFSSGGPWEEIIGYSRVVRAGDLFMTAGCTATVDGQLVGVGDPYLQAKTAFEVGLAALEKAGCPAENVIATKMYIKDGAHADDVCKAHKDTVGAAYPVTTLLVVAGFLSEEMLVEVELTGYAAQ